MTLSARMAQHTPLKGYAHYAHFNITNPDTYVAHVEINRPAKLNAFKRVMWIELRAIFTQLSTDPEVRAVVLSGAGDRAFTAGLDVQAASQGETAVQGPKRGVDGARAATAMRREVYEFQACISAIEKCEKRGSPFPIYDATFPPARPSPRLSSKAEHLPSLSSCDMYPTRHIDRPGHRHIVLC